MLEEVWVTKTTDLVEEREVGVVLVLEVFSVWTEEVDVELVLDVEVDVDVDVDVEVEVEVLMGVLAGVVWDLDGVSTGVVVETDCEGVSALGEGELPAAGLIGTSSACRFFLIIR